MYSQHPFETAVEIRVNDSDIIQSDWLVQKHSVKGEAESGPDVVSVKEGQTDHTPHKVKVGQVVLRAGTRNQHDAAGSRAEQLTGLTAELGLMCNVYMPSCV